MHIIRSLVLPNGEYAMSLSQVVSLFYEKYTKMSVKSLKQRTGLELKSIQRSVKTGLDHIDALGIL